MIAYLFVSYQIDLPIFIGRNVRITYGTEASFDTVPALSERHRRAVGTELVSSQPLGERRIRVANTSPAPGPAAILARAWSIMVAYILQDQLAVIDHVNFLTVRQPPLHRSLTDFPLAAAVIVHARTFLHPALPQPDAGRVYRCLTQFPGRVPGCLVPLSDLDYELCDSQALVSGRRPRPHPRRARGAHHRPRPVRLPGTPPGPLGRRPPQGVAPTLTRSSWKPGTGITPTSSSPPRAPASARNS